MVPCLLEHIHTPNKQHPSTYIQPFVHITQTAANMSHCIWHSILMGVRVHYLFCDGVGQLVVLRSCMIFIRRNTREGICVCDGETSSHSWRGGRSYKNARREIINSKLKDLSNKMFHMFHIELVRQIGRTECQTTTDDNFNTQQVGVAGPRRPCPIFN